MYIIFLVLIGFVSSCLYKNERFQDGDTWVVRSTFVLKCKITSNGWTTTVIGCKTPGGVVVEPGRIIKEGDTSVSDGFKYTSGVFDLVMDYSEKLRLCNSVQFVTAPISKIVTYECISMGNGRVEIKRTYNFDSKRASCEGHEIGESWVSQHNFRKTCTDKGAEISECLTDSGISVPLNQNLVLSGIVYTCTHHPNGTVTINREGVPSPNNFKTNSVGSMEIARFCSFVHVWRLRCMGYLGGVGAGGVFQLKPVEVLGPMWKRFKSLGRLLQSPLESHNKPELISPTTTTIGEPNSVQNEITCVSNGIVYKPEETWISDNKFTKKCTPDGSVIILNCLMDDKTTINVNTELKLGKNTYKCYRSKKGGRIYFEVITE